MNIPFYPSHTVNHPMLSWQNPGDFTNMFIIWKIHVIILVISSRSFCFPHSHFCFPQGSPFASPLRRFAWTADPVEAGDSIEDALLRHGIVPEALREAWPQAPTAPLKKGTVSSAKMVLYRKNHGEWDIHGIYMGRLMDIFMDIFMEHQWNMNEIVLGYLLVSTTVPSSKHTKSYGNPVRNSSWNGGFSIAMLVCGKVIIPSPFFLFFLQVLKLRDLMQTIFEFLKWDLAWYVLRTSPIRLENLLHCYKTW